jgi:hypothetical protein
VHVRLVDFHVAKLRRRITLDRPCLGALAHDLPVDLHVLRNVDDEVALDGRRAGEPPLLAKLAALRNVARLGLRKCREMIVGRGDPVLGELALGDLDLAAPTDAAPAAHAFDIDPERPRRVEHRHAKRKPPPPPRRHEQHKCILGGSVHLEAASAPAPPSPLWGGVGVGT